LADGASVELGKLLLCTGEADLESFHLAEPAVAFGFGDARVKVVADLEEPGTLGRVGPERRAANAGFSGLWGRSVPKPLICSSLKPNW
jgi:hypothetical protein